MHEAEQLQWIIAVINVTAVCVGLALVKLVVDSVRQRPKPIHKFGEILFGIVITNLVMIFVVIGAIMPAVWNSEDVSAPAQKGTPVRSDVNKMGIHDGSPSQASVPPFLYHVPINR